jgi:hypothetical protein
MYEASCDLQPDSNMFWTTKKCIGELYEPANNALVYVMQC